MGPWWANNAIIRGGAIPRRELMWPRIGVQTQILRPSSTCSHVSANHTRHRQTSTSSWKYKKRVPEWVTAWMNSAAILLSLTPLPSLWYTSPEQNPPKDKPQTWNLLYELQIVCFTLASGMIIWHLSYLAWIVISLQFTTSLQRH